MAMLFGIVLTGLVAAPGSYARADLTRMYHLQQCPGTVHAGFTTDEQRPALGYGRYSRISCRRARDIIKLVDDANGSFPAGYSWETPHGAPSDWPIVFGHVLAAAYLSPDGIDGGPHKPGVAVVVFRR